MKMIAIIKKNTVFLLTKFKIGGKNRNWSLKFNLNPNY